MKGVIQAGGLGTRLHPVTLEIPKPLLPVHRKPIIQYLVELFLAGGITEIFVLANTKDIDLFEKWKKEYKNKHVNIVEEKERLGTWGGIQKYLSKELADTFIVSNGDELKEIEIPALANFHKKKNALVTIAALEVPSAKDYGVLVGDKEGRVKEFLYKPERPPVNFVMAGIYAAEPELFNLHFESDVLSVEQDVFPQLIAQKKLYEFRYNGRWYDCGTFERYEKAIMNW